MATLYEKKTVKVRVKLRVMLGFNVIKLFKKGQQKKGQKKDSAGIFRARPLVFMNIVREITFL